MGFEPIRIRFYRTKSLTKLGLLYAPNILILMKGIGKNLSWRTMEQVKVIETSSIEWQSTVLAVVLHLHLEAKTRIELATY